MYDSNKEAAIEFVRGAGFVILVMGVFFTFVLLLSGPAEKKPEKFKVVDKYNECNVVRYTDRSNQWHYFLDCSGRETVP